MESAAVTNFGIRDGRGDSRGYPSAASIYPEAGRMVLRSWYDTVPRRQYPSTEREKCGSALGGRLGSGIQIEVPAKYITRQMERGKPHVLLAHAVLFIFKEAREDYGLISEELYAVFHVH